MTSQASTKIEDLPDNNKIISSKILKELNEDIQSDTDNEEVVISNTEVKQEGDMFNYKKIIEYAKDSFLVFLLVFILSHKSVVSVLSNLPYIRNYEPRSIIHNGLISLIISIVYFASKYLIDLYQ